MTPSRMRDVLLGLGLLAIVAGIYLGFGVALALVAGGVLAILVAILWAFTDIVNPA